MALHNRDSRRNKDCPTVQMESHPAAKWFVAGDLEGSFGLFFSGFPDLLLIAGLASLCGFSPTLVATRILPGVAISIFAGNVSTPGRRAGWRSAPDAAT